MRSTVINLPIRQAREYAAELAEVLHGIDEKATHLLELHLLLIEVLMVTPEKIDAKTTVPVTEQQLLLLLAVLSEDFDVNRYVSHLCAPIPGLYVQAGHRGIGYGNMVKPDWSKVFPNTQSVYSQGATDDKPT